MLEFKEVETKDLGFFGSHRDREIVEVGEEVFSTSHPRDSILFVNPRLSVKSDDLGKLRYLYKIPKLVEVHALEIHKRVD